MAIAGEIQAVLDLNVDRFKKGIKKAKEGASRFKKAMDRLDEKIKRSKKEVDRFSQAAQAAFGAVVTKEILRTGAALAKLGAEFRDARAAFDASGQSLDDFRQATGGLISDADLIQKFNLARSLGVSAEAFKALGAAAAASARSTGQSVKQLFSDAITGTARGSAQILDNLGIKVKATGDRAKFLADVIKETNRLVAESGSTADSATAKYARFQAGIDNLNVSIGLLADNLVTNLGAALSTIFSGDDVAEFGTTLVNAFKAFGTVVLDLLDFLSSAFIDVATAPLEFILRRIGDVQVLLGKTISALGSIPGLEGLRGTGAGLAASGRVTRSGAEDLAKELKTIFSATEITKNFLSLFDDIERKNNVVVAKQEAAADKLTSAADKQEMAAPDPVSQVQIGATDFSKILELDAELAGKTLLSGAKEFEEVLEGLADEADEVSAAFSATAKTLQGLSGGEIFSRELRDILPGTSRAARSGAGRVLDTALSGGDITTQIGTEAGTAIGGAIGGKLGQAIGGPVGGQIAGAVISVLSKSFSSLIDVFKQTLGGFITDQRLKGIGAFTSSLVGAIPIIFALGTVINLLTGGLFTLALPILVLAGAILVLTKETENFAKVQQAFNNAIDGFFKPFESIAFELLALATVLEILTPVFGELLAALGGDLPNILFTAFKLAGLAALGFVIAIESVRAPLGNAVAGLAIVLNQVQIAFIQFVDGINQLLGSAGLGFGGGNERAVAIRDAESEISRLEQFVGTASDTFEDATDAFQDLFQLTLGEGISRALDGLADSTDNAANNLNDFGEELVNVPEGFKVGLERFRATIPGLGGDGAVPGPGEPGAEGAGGSPIVLQDPVFMVSDVEDFVSQIREIGVSQSLEQTGAVQGEEFRTGGSI